MLVLLDCVRLFLNLNSAIDEDNGAGSGDI